MIASALVASQVLELVQVVDKAPTEVLPWQPGTAPAGSCGRGTANRIGKRPFRPLTRFRRSRPVLMLSATRGPGRSMVGAETRLNPPASTGRVVPAGVKLPAAA